jgi:histidine ammonia-lyase
MSQQSVIIDGHRLTVEDVVRVAGRKDIRVALAPEAIAAINRSRALIDRFVERREVVYGVTTGFGNFKKVHINPEQTAELQRNLIMSHAVGVGKPLAEREVRAMMLIRLNSLVRGHSGIRQETAEVLMALLNAGIYPYVPEQGSVGASGDLAPLAHVALVVMGDGEAWDGDRWTPARPALDAAGITPAVLMAKEGLALTNGTAFMAAIQSWNCFRALNLVRVADIVGCLTLEACMGSVVPAQERVAAVRPHPGHAAAAENIRTLTAQSAIIKSHEGCDRVQDSYSLRCMPQVHGAVRDALDHCRAVLDRELNAATDNPLIFPDDGEVVSAGNFHGEPLALTGDYLAIAMAEVADISERRIAKTVDNATNEGLPAFLIPPEQAGLSSGFMIPQYTAAALVSENNSLAHPASVDSIPTSANQEDHVSMGSIAVRKCRDIITNAERVLAIELLTAAQALDFRSPHNPGVGTKVAFDLLRSRVPFLERDRVLYRDMEVATELVRSGALVAAVEATVGQLR